MRILALDGNSILNRAFYGVRALSTQNGEFTNAVYGFLQILFRLREQLSPDGVVAAFDLAAPTFRHKLYPSYKSGRRHMPDELASQLPLIKEALTLLGCTVAEQEGYEADDILGTLARAAEEQASECFIATGDRDSLQLVSDRVTVLLATTKAGHPETVTYDTAAIREKYGLSPAQLIDLKALMGDASDKIPGVPGVGEKTALELMHTFGSLDALYRELSGAALRETLRQKLMLGEESARLSRTLGTICRTVPMDTELEHYRVRPYQKPELLQLLTRLEFFKLIDKLGLQAETDAPAAVGEPAAVSLPVCGDEALPEVRQQAARGTLDAVLSTEGEEAGTLWVCLPDKLVHLSSPLLLREVWSDPKLRLRTHDSKPLYAALLAAGIEPCVAVMDTRLAAYLLNPLDSSDYPLAQLARQRGIASAPDTAPAAVFPAVADALTQEIREQGQEPLLTEVELPLALVLADMERIGVAVDADGLRRFGEQLTGQIEALQDGIYREVGYTFNLNSQKQLSKALFEDLGLPSGKKLKSGYSTSADVLEKLRHAHPAVEMLLTYRTFSKLKSTYCDGLLKVIGADGRIHSSFNQTETRTGRISSAEPNLQNIPVRQELGRELRRFFRAADGCVLCDADYSQIELRVLAHMAGDAAMIQAFNSGEDIHRITASQVFDVPEDAVTPQMRSYAKAVNFGIVYGIGAHSLAEDIHVSYAEAKRYIDGYMRHYSDIAAYMEHLIETARATGYAETLFGRRRPLPELRAGNHVTRAFGERVARNMPIQGTAADIIKIAMVRVWRRLRRERLQAQLILQVHDELIVEAPDAESAQVCALLQEEMEAAAAMRVRLAAEVHTGRSWYEAKD